MSAPQLSRRLRLPVALAIVGAATLTAATASATPSRAAAGPVVVTASHDAQRTGWYPDQPGLAPGKVSSTQFGQLFDTVVTGQVYAQPLVANGTLLVATEQNNVYGLDPDKGTVKWSVHLRTPYHLTQDPSTGPGATQQNPGICPDLTPDVGITSTPVVVDNTMYLTSKGYADNNPANLSNTNVGYWLYALDITTGSIKSGFPVRIPQDRRADNRPSDGPTFIARYQLQRTALLYKDGVVYFGFGSHCDVNEFRGWVAGVSTTGQVKAMWSSAINAFSGAGIWQSGSGIMQDPQGRLFVATGNGVQDDYSGLPSNTPPGNCSQCIVRLEVQGDGTLAAKNFYQPYDSIHLDLNDADFASGGPVLLPANFGTTGAHATAAYAKQPIVSVGKEGYVYLLDPNDLGGFQSGSSGGDHVLARVGPDGGVWSKPAIWPGDGGWVYIPTAAGNAQAAGSQGFFNAYRKAGTPTAPTLSMQTSQVGAETFGFGSSAPIVTSDGTNDGSAVVWIVHMDSPSDTSAQLRAYQAVPQNGKMQLIRSFPVGKASKFNPAGVGSGRVYVGTNDGHVRGFGIPTSAPLAGSSLAFGQVVVGDSKTLNATLDVIAVTVKVTSIQTSGAGFSAGTPSPPVGTTMSKDDTLTVPITFHPTSAGSSSGTLTLKTDHGDVLVGLNGVGEPVEPTLAVNATSISFGGVEVGASKQTVLVFTNVGASTLTFDDSTPPVAPFSASSLPGAGDTLAPQESRSVPVTFAPTAFGNPTGSFTVHSDGGDITVHLSGASAPPAKLAVSARSIDLGDVVIGRSSTRVLQIRNTGGLPLTITKSKAPTFGPFKVSNTVPEGSTIPVGGTISIVVTFTPTAAGAQTASWALNGSGASQATTVTMRGTGIAHVPAGAMSFAQPAQIPTRLYDTRTIRAPLAAGVTRTIPVLGRAGVPSSGVAGVMVTASAVNPRGSGYLSIFPCGTSATATSTANFTTGHGVSNLALVPIGTGGAICAWSSVATDLVIDVGGVTSPYAGSLSNAIGPTRLLDTRQSGGAFKAGETRAYQVAGRAGVPSDATGVLLNVTSFGSTATGSLVVYPCGMPRPGAVNMTYIAHATIASLTTAALGDGTVCVYATAPTHVLLDVDGYVRTNGGRLTRSVTPWRALDTRAAPGTRLAARAARAVTVVNAAKAVPAGVTSVLLEVTAVSPLAAGSLIVYPCGTTPPSISNLVFTGGAGVHNMVSARVPSSGKVCVYSSASTHLVVDVLGYTK
jgi:iron transport multicopper oxidase